MISLLFAALMGATTASAGELHVGLDTGALDIAVSIPVGHPHVRPAPVVVKPPPRVVYRRPHPVVVHKPYPVVVHKPHPVVVHHKPVKKVVLRR